MLRKNLLVLAILFACFIVSLPVINAEEKDQKKYDDKECKLSKISTADLKKAIKDKTVTIVDTNGTKSYAIGHILDSHDLGAEGFAGRLPMNKNNLIVVYNGGEQCSEDKDPCKKCTANSELREKCCADKTACDKCADKKEMREKCNGNKGSTESSNATKEAAEKLIKLGYTNVKCYCAGLKGWVEAGGTLEKE